MLYETTILSDFASWGSEEYKDTEYCSVPVDTSGRITEELLFSLIEKEMHH